MTFTWFTNGDLHGTRGGDVEPVHADAAVSRTATTFTQTPTSSGSFAFQATYSGDGTYTGSTGPCEPLTVTHGRVDDGDGDPRRGARDGDVGAGGHDGARPGDGDRAVGLATPTGTVTFTWFTNGTCAAPGGDVEPVHARRPGVADATAFTQTPERVGELRVPGDLLG